VLALLVLASIILSLRIWEGLLPPTIPANASPPRGTFLGPSCDPLDLIMPVRIIVHRGEESRWVLYAAESLFHHTWQQVLDLLQELGGRSREFQLEPADLQTWQQAQEQPGLELIFDCPLNGQVWSQLLEYGQPLVFDPPIKRMLLSMGPEPALLFTTEAGDVGARLQLADHSERWQELMEKLAGEELLAYNLLRMDNTPFGLYLPREDLSYPVLKTEGEALEPAVVASSFFADLSLTRRIEERDGATIYTDGRQGLRVWPSGQMEYNAPELLPGVPLPPHETFSRAVRFVTQHGGWPLDMRLAGLTEIESGAGSFYRLVFRGYLQGLPLDYSRLELDRCSRGVAVYRRQLRIPSYQAGSAILAVEELEESLLAAVSLDHQLADLVPGYVLAEESWLLQPRWLIQTTTGQLLELADLPGGDTSELEAG
ncbi:MAG TPA: hypothetical protein VJ036_01150, partial [bacterium]|nr:hypothetical protein [bacterium]